MDDADYCLSEHMNNILFNLFVYSPGDRLYRVGNDGHPEFFQVTKVSKDSKSCVMERKPTLLVRTDQTYALSYFDGAWDAPSTGSEVMPVDAMHTMFLCREKHALAIAQPDRA